MSKTSDFIAWLKAREEAGYVWGAQGQEAAADGALYLDGKRVAPSWEKWVDARETNPANAERAKAFIRKKLDAGNGSVPLFDCSGLVMRYLQNVKGILPSIKTRRACWKLAGKPTGKRSRRGTFSSGITA